MSKASGSSAVANGTFLIADISGYTEYLAGTDLDHAPAIATDLLTRVVDAIRMLFSVNKVEGDAVFCVFLRPRPHRLRVARCGRRDVCSLSSPAAEHGSSHFLWMSGLRHGSRP